MKSSEGMCKVVKLGQSRARFAVEMTMRLFCSLIFAASLVLSLHAQEPDASAESYPHLRIVDPETVRQKPVLPVRILTAPFNFVGSGMQRGLNFVEEQKALDRLQVILSNPHIHPLFGSIGDGSGFGGGVAFSTVGITRQDAGFIGDVQVTAKRYVEANGGMRFQRPSTRFGKVTFDITAGYNLRPEEDFWGSGATPGSLRTNYDLQERSGGARIEIAPYKTFRSGIEARYSATSIFDGKDSRFQSTDAVFGNTLPGFNGAELSETSFFAEYDTRNGNTAPVKALYAMGRISSVDGLNGGNFGYWQYRVDQRAYLPLWSNRRVLAVRTLAIFNDTKGNAEIPFFRLARLGDSQTLRGYDSYRFCGRNATAWNLEYRTDLTGGLGAFAFTDFGQVFDRRVDFGARNFRVTYGGGLQIKSKKSIILRTYLAHSEEGSRLMVTFGPTF